MLKGDPSVGSDGDERNKLCLTLQKVIYLLTLNVPVLEELAADGPTRHDKILWAAGQNTWPAAGCNHSSIRVPEAVPRKLQRRQRQETRLRAITSSPRLLLPPRTAVLLLLLGTVPRLAFL